MHVVVPAAAGVLGLALGPWLARTTVRLGRRDPLAAASTARTVPTGLLAAGLLVGAALLVGLRPALVGLGWAACAAVVLAGCDLLSHRLPDRVTAPAAVVVALAWGADAAVTGEWAAVLRAALAAAAALGIGLALALVSPQGLGLGDVKLLGLLGLVLGRWGWEVLLAGVFLGLLLGAAVSVLLLVTRRAGWRTAIPFGPPLMAGAALALALAGPLPA